MAKFVKTTATTASLDSSAKFVAFANTSGVYPDVTVWERLESNWTPVAGMSDCDFGREISSEDLELEVLTRDGGAVLFGADCTRQQFFEFVFGTDAFEGSAFAESDPEELGFESDVWFPANMLPPDYLVSNNGCLVEYHDGLDWDQAEAEVRKDLDALNEYTHREMYGHSYMA